MLWLDDLHLFQTFQHAPQVGDAILKGDFLILARMGTLKQFPHVYLWFLYPFLLPVSKGKGIYVIWNREALQIGTIILCT